jgi:hypothetical protein
VRLAFSILAAGLLSLTTSSIAHACLPPDKPAFWRDRPIRVHPDGSFDRAEDQFYFTESGLPVVDVGSGKVGQRIRTESFCGSGEKLLLVDCIAAKLIVIDGQVNPAKPDDFGGGPSNSVDMLYPPHGRIRLTKSTSIAGLVQVATKAGYEFETDPAVAFEMKNKKNRYDPFTGCRLFYPESAGAKL